MGKSALLFAENPKKNIVLASKPVKNRVNIISLNIGDLIRFYTSSRHLVKTIILTDSNVAVPISGLSIGIYFIKITRKLQTRTQKLLIQ